MVTSVVSSISAQRTTPYITPDMFRTHARAGVQVDNLVPGGKPADNEAALALFIEEASSWVDLMAERTFVSTSDTVQAQVNVDRDGFVEIHPRYTPVIGLTAFSIGATPAQLQPLSTLSGVGWLQDGGFSIPVYPLSLTSSQGPLQFGGVGCPWDRAWCQYSYQHSWPVTYLSADVAAAATSISVLDTTGIVAGRTWLTIYSGKTRYSFLATSVSTADAGGLGTGAGTVGCAAVPFAIDNPVTNPVMVSALPSTGIAAAVLATRAFIKQKGAGAVSATNASARSSKEGRRNAGDDFAEAWEMVQRMMQVAVTQ
jgi:hypothetical protein